MGGPDACLVIDDTALPKKGTLSVGVARQYCGALGKQANCQSLVSLTLAQGEVPVPVGLRLFLPEAWTSDPGRCVQAGVPEPATVPRSKGEIALCELDRLRVEGLRFGTVLADAGFRRYVATVLVPTLKPGDVVILDNLGSQRQSRPRRQPRGRRSSPVPAALQPRSQPD